MQIIAIQEDTYNYKPSDQGLILIKLCEFQDALEKLPPQLQMFPNLDRTVFHCDIEQIHLDDEEIFLEVSGLSNADFLDEDENYLPCVTLELSQSQLDDIGQLGDPLYEIIVFSNGEIQLASTIPQEEDGCYLKTVPLSVGPFWKYPDRPDIEPSGITIWRE